MTFNKRVRVRWKRTANVSCATETEILPNVKMRKMKFLRYWGPVLVWAAVISVASTSAFKGTNTANYIIPILHWLLPKAEVWTLWEIHYRIRKAAHVFEFGLFAILFMRGLRAGRKEWRWSWVAATMIVVACYAALDEFHQAFVPGRGASAWDSLLDTSGGAAGMVLMWFVSRRNKAPAGNESGRALAP